MEIQEVKSCIRDVPDFPKPGILFKDITPLLQNASAFAYVIDTLAGELAAKDVDVIVAMESRGFIFAPALAYKLGIGIVPARKQGKLPWKTHTARYALEYGEATLEIHEDALKPGQRVAIIDDLLATGGTAEATARLIEGQGAEVAIAAFVLELSFLKGRERLSQYDVFSLLKY